jgi:hypothetical protein
MFALHEYCFYLHTSVMETESVSYDSQHEGAQHAYC